MKLKALIHARSYSRSRVTKVYNTVRDSVNNFDRVQISQFLSIFKDLSNSLKDLDEKVLSNLWDDTISDEDNAENHNKELDSVTDYKIKINNGIILLEEELSKLNSPRDPSPERAPNPPLNNTCRLKPETAPLPTYSGERDESLEKFIFSFESITDAHNYSDFEKFLLLQKCMKGRARILINSLEIDKQSYTDAKALLHEAFAAPLTQRYNALERLISLGSLADKDPLLLVSEMRQIKEAFNRLNINIQLVLQFFYWRALPDKIKTQLINISNVCKPDLCDIERNIFQAIERNQSYESSAVSRNSEDSGSSRRKTNAYAVKVEQSESNRSEKTAIKCTLCSESHAYYRCDKYKTAEEKVKRLKDLNGCTKCGYINHMNENCKLSNLKCKLCSGIHFPCLCIKVKTRGSSSNDNSSDKGAPKISSNIVWTSSADVAPAEGLALPTFTGLVDNKIVRIMRDTGAQATLITENLANNSNLKIVKNNISITINGFNGAKHYLTKLVEVPVTFGEVNSEVIVVRALCVPHINISLDVPGLGSLVTKLKFKGYDIADKLFDSNSNSISNIDIVLGSDFSYCNPITTKLFGKNKDSSLLLTPVGVMIEGPISRLLSDIDYLDDSIFVNSYNIAECERDFSVYSVDHKISQSDLQSATDGILEKHCALYLGNDDVLDDSTVEINRKLANYVLDSSSRCDDGRLIFGLMWNSEVMHLLGHNYNLSLQILKSNFRRLSKDPLKLKLTDQVFREQEKLGIIERIHDFEKFKTEYPNFSFLPHMSVFRLNKETTKCRVVYLSNIAENNPKLPRTISHNQAIMSGPNLNQKLSTSLLLLKFDKCLMIYDLVKAFLMIAMNNSDQARLLLMWYQNVEKDDFNVVYYKAKRLPFGISCAPALLMIALYKILIVDDDKSDLKVTNLRQLSYTLLYMDNGGYSSNEVSGLYWARNNLIKIFGKYKFDLQQFVCNVNSMQEEMDAETGEKTPETVSLYGLKWNRISDSLSTAPVSLEPTANTKRLILKSYAENFDVYGYNLPLFNRTKLFIHRLQCTSSLSWDAVLSSKLQKEWRLICNQINCVNVKNVPRFVGNRSDSYRLVVFTDSSKDLYGIVLYIVNLTTFEVGFLLAKNRIVGTNLEGKSIPSLELCAVLFGVETLLNIYNELCNDSMLEIINVEGLSLYTDSMITLNWLDGVTNKLNKSQNKLSVFNRNRLFRIQTLCNKKSVTFNFISGVQNPSDMVTRAVSSKQLEKTNFYSGPEFLKVSEGLPNVLSVTVPCPAFVVNTATVDCFFSSVNAILPFDKYSSFDKLINVLSIVLEFVHKLKQRFRRETIKKQNFHTLAQICIIKEDQHFHFSDCISYFNHKEGKLRSMPNIVKQLNVFTDGDGVLRVQGKFKNRLVNGNVYQPILLSKNSLLADLIINTLHARMGHSGKYVVLVELRKEFYIPSCFSKVKNVLNKCIVCRRFNARAVALNQSPYRAERLNPQTIPFSFIYMDHFGPYSVKIGGKKVKIYLLLLTCMYTRAFNAEICVDMTVQSFLKAFQMHSHRYGVPSRITSDSGSTLVAGGNVISAFLGDQSVSSYFSRYNIDKIEFTHFCKGNSSLGGLVESGVKLYKKLIYGFIRNNCLSFHDFQFIISDVNHLINKRPVALMEATRDSSVDEAPEVITPEMLIHGFSLPSVNCIPGLQPIPDDPLWEIDPHNVVRDSYKQLRSVRSKMLEMYNEEFFSKLVHQAVDRGDRYVPKHHSLLSVGDVVCMKERFCKPNNYPLAVVREITLNDLGEVTSALIKRGDTGEIVNRHSTTLIPILQLKTPTDTHDETKVVLSRGEQVCRGVPRRKAAVKASSKIADQLQ